MLIKWRKSGMVLGLMTALPLAAAAQRGRGGMGGFGGGGREASSVPAQLDGALEAVFPDFITIRLADGRLFDVQIPYGPISVAIADTYTVGDQVEAKLRKEPPAFSPADNIFFYVSLSQLSLKKHPDPAELAAALSSPDWQAGGNQLKLPPGAQPPSPPPPPAPDDPFLAQARSTVLAYVQDLPNFLVTEHVTRTTTAAEHSSTDEVSSELTVTNGQEKRDNIVFNGAAWDHPFAQLPGAKWTSDFAEKLKPIFNPACGTEFLKVGESIVNGVVVEVYSFVLRSGLCAGVVESGAQHVYPGLQGRVSIDEKTGLVMRLEETYDKFPEMFPIEASQDEIYWAPIVVNGVSHLMPATSQMNFTTGARVSERLICQYTNYHQFETSSRIVVVGKGSK